MALQVKSHSFPALLLAAAVLAASVLASPYLHVEWQMNFNVAPNIILVDHGLILTSTETQQAGGYLNTVRALNASQSVVWTFTTFGQVSILTTAAAFPSISKLTFLLSNNLSPPNVTAIVPSTGEVVWSSAAAFATSSSPNLQASFDGQILYLFTESVAQNGQLTAFDAATGGILFTNENVAPRVAVTRCGPSRKACVVEWSQTGATFLDGHTGASLKNVSVPIQTAEWYPYLVPTAQDLLILGNVGDVVVINTTNYTVAWKSEPWGTPSQYVLAYTEEYDAAHVKRLAVVVIGITGIVGFDAETGAALWNKTAEAICPSVSPAPGLASSFVWYDFQLGSFPPLAGAGDLFSFAVTCQYASGSLSIVGSMSATNGAVKWWRYISSYPQTYPLLPVGPAAFMVYSPQSQTEEFYDRSMAYIGSFTQYGAGYTLAGVMNETAVIQWNYYGSPRVSGVSVIYRH